MARRQQHSFTPLRAATANTEGQQAVASVSAKTSHQDTLQPKIRANSGHSDALSYRAVAARAVGVCSTSSSTPPSVQSVMVSQSCGGKCETHPPRPTVDSYQPVASRTQAASAEVPPVTRSQRFTAAPDSSLNPVEPGAAPLASGTVSGVTAREKFCTNASLTVAACGAASTGQVSARKKTNQRDHGALRQSKQQSSDCAFVAPTVSQSHLIVGADSGTAQLQTPLSTTPGSTFPLGTTQERGSSKKQGTRPIPTGGLPAVEVVFTQEEDSGAVASPDIHMKGRRLEVSLRAKKKKQQQRQQVSAQHGVTEQHSQQHDLTDRQPRHRAQQLQQQSETEVISFEHGKKQQLMAYQQQNQQKLKQHRSRPVLVKRQRNDHREDGPAKQSFVINSFDGATSDASEGIDGGTTCWSVKKGTLPRKGGTETQEHTKGRGEGPSNSTVFTDSVPQDAYSTNCGKTGAGYTPYGRDKAKVRQQYGEEPNDRSQITCCNSNISSGSSTCSSSTTNGRSDTSSSSISSNCSTSCTSASRSSNGSGSGGIPSSTSTIKPCNGSTSNIANVGVAAILHHTIQCRDKTANTAPAVHSGRHASCRVGVHQSKYTKSIRGKTKDELRQQTGGTTAGQQNNADHEVLPPLKGNCSHNRQDSRHHRASPVFEKHMNNNQARVVTQRHASACGGHCQPLNDSSSRRCGSAFHTLNLADSTDGSHAGMDVDVDNCIAHTAGTDKARPADGRPQFGAETDAVFPSEIDVSRSTSVFMAESAASASLGDHKREHENQRKQRGSTIQNRRRRSTSCVGSMPRQQANTTETDVRLARTTRVNPAAAKSAASYDIRLRETIDSSSIFPSTVGACKAASVAAGTTAAVVPIASPSGFPADVSPFPGTSSSVHAEISMSPGLGTSLKLASSKMARSFAAVDVKWVAGGQKDRTAYESTSTPTVLKPERHQNVGAVASGVLLSNSSSEAAIKGDGRIRYSGHLVQSNAQCLTTTASSALEATATSMCRRAGDTYLALPKASLNSAKRRPASTVTSAALTVGAAFITATTSADDNIKKTAASQRSDESHPADTNSGNRVQPTASYARTVKSQLSDSFDKRDIVEPSVADSVPQKLTTFSRINAKGSADAEKDDSSAALIAALSSSEVHRGAAITAASVPSNVILSGHGSAAAAGKGKDSTECQNEEATTACQCANSIRGDNLEETLISKMPTSTTTERMSLLLPDGSLNLKFFKVFPCKNRNILHEKKVCPHYHNSRDRRRAPVTYRAEQCEEHFDLDTASVQCSKGEACDKSHNRHELLYHPHIYKQRFCSSLPCTVPFRRQDEERGNHPNARKGMTCFIASSTGWGCVRGVYCAFAHSREEIRASLFTEEEERNPDSQFFVNKFKTIWCPYGSQHDWRTCVYAHTYQDCRRSPLIGYGSEPCAAWNKDLHSADYEKRCPHGARCSFSHGSKEQLYHPSYYKTMPCIDYRPAATGGSNNRGRAMAHHRGGTAECAMNFTGRASGLADAGGCPRGFLCAFYHEGAERRVPTPPASQFAYAAPLAISQLKLLQPLFLKPPLFNLDDFEAFGHTSRQTAALRRSQALNNAQSAGEREPLKQGLRAATTASRTGGAIPNNEVAFCLCATTKLEYRSNCSHKLRAAVAPRFQEIGTLSSPQQTKWLSNSSPPNHRLAEGTQTSFLAFAAGTARTAVPADASAAASTRDVCASVANAIDMEGAVTATPDIVNAHALARAVATILPGGEKGAPYTSEQNHSEKTLSPAGSDFDPFVHHTNQVGSSSRSSNVKRETVSAAVRGEEAYSLPADTIQAQQGSPNVPTSCSSSAQQQLERKLQYELQPEGLVERQWHEREQQQDPNEAQYELRSQWPLHKHQLQRHLQEQQKKHQETKAQITEAIAKTVHAGDCTDRWERDLRSTNVAEVAVAASVHIIKAGEGGHVLAGDQSAAVRATSRARTEKESSTGARQAGAAGDGARAAEAREAAGGTVESVTSLDTGGLGAAATLAFAEHYTEAQQQTAMPPPIAPLLIEHSPSAYACGGSSQVACLQKETPGETRRLGSREATHYCPLPEYSNLSQHLVSLQEALNDHCGRLSYEQPFQTIASMQEHQSERGELQHSQPRGQHRQSLLQRQDHLVAAVSSTDQHASFPTPLRRWNSLVTNNPVSSDDLHNAFNANECVQDSMRAAVASAFDQSLASKKVSSATPPADQRDASRSEVLKEDVFLHTASERRGVHRLETDSAGVEEHANVVSGGSSDADRAQERVKGYISGKIEGRRIAGRDAVSSSTLARAAEAAASRWRGLCPGLSTQKQAPVLVYQLPSATLWSPGTKGENYLKATPSRTEDTLSDPSCQPQQPHCRMQDTREQDNCSQSQRPDLHKLSSTGSRMGQATSNCVNSSDIDSSNCSSNKASASGHNHTNSYNSSDNKRQGGYSSSTSSVLGTSECSGHPASRMDSSRAGSVSERKFVGLFNNGWVWQVPFSGSITGKSPISLCAAAGSDRKVFNCDNRISWKSDATCSLTPSSSTFFNICDNAGALDTEASREYSPWVVPSLASDKYSLPASSPAFPGTGQTPWSATTAATGDDIDTRNNARHSHVLQLRSAAPFQCRSSPQLFTEDVGVRAGEMHTTGAHADALAAFGGDIHAVHPAHHTSAVGGAEKPIEAAASTGVFATYRLAAAAGAAAHAEGKPEGALEQDVSVRLKRSECEIALKAPSHLLGCSLQRPTNAPQQHTSCAYQQQLVSNGFYSRSPTSPRTARHNCDTHHVADSTATAAGIGVIGAALRARTGDPSSLTTRTLTENAAAFPSLGWDLRLTRNSARPTDTAVFTDEHKTQYSSIIASAAESSVDAGNPFSWRESPYESGSNSFATDHDNCGSGEHSGNGKGINSTTRSGEDKFYRSSSSFGLSIPAEDNSPSHNDNCNHRMRNYTQPLSAGGPSLWGCAVYAVGDSAATENLGEFDSQEMFASSAPPRLYNSGAEVLQRQERRQQKHHSEALLQEPQQRHKEKYELPLHLLRPRFHPQQQEQQGFHRYGDRVEDIDRHENPRQQPKFLPHSERRHAREQFFLPPRTLHEEHECQGDSGFDGQYCYSASREDVSAASWPKPQYELWDRIQDAPGACSARSQSEQGAAAAAAVLNLLDDDDERLEHLRQHEERILSASNSAVGKNDILPPSSASAALPASAIFSSLGDAVTDSKQATARGCVLLSEHSVLSPVETEFTAEAPRKTGLPHAQAPLCLAGSANKTCHFRKERLAWTGCETDRDASFPSEVTSEPQHHCAGGDNNPIYPTDDARPGAAVTGAATTTMEARTASDHESGVGAKADFNASHWTATIFTNHPASSRGVTEVAPGLRTAPTAARTTVGGPLVIGTGTPLDQQQLLLSLLRLQLWEKLFVILHSTAASSPDAMHSKGSQQTMLCARRPHSVGLSTEGACRVEEGRAEVTAAAGAPDCGSAALVSEANEVVGEVAERRMADAPTGRGLAGAAGQTGGEVLEEISAAKIPADVINGDQTTAIEDSFAAVEKETALLAKTAEKAHYSCDAGFTDRDDGFQPTGRRSALVALEAAGLHLWSKSEYPGDANDRDAKADRATRGMQPRAQQVLKQQLYVLTQAPQRAPRQQHANGKPAGERIQERSPQTERHRRDRQHLKTCEKMEVDNGEERVTTLSPDALNEPERSLLAVIHLHRTPAELNQWFSRLYHQRVHRENSTSKSDSCNDGNSDCHTSSGRGSPAAGLQTGNATLCTLESDLQEACQTQAGVIEMEKETTDRRGGTATLPQGAPAGAGVGSQVVVDPPGTAAPPEAARTPSTGAAVRKQVAPTGGTSTAALTHVVVLHVVCNCHSSLDLLSYLTSEQQKRCFFPQVHELPLWSALLHCASRQRRSPLRRGRSVHRTITNDSRNMSGCAARACSSTSRGSTGSDTATNTSLLVAGSPPPPSTPPSFSFDTASVQSETSSAATATNSVGTSAPSSTNGGDDRPSSDITGTSTKSPKQRNIHMQTNTQSWQRGESDAKTLQVPQKGTIVTERSETGHRLHEQSAGRTATATTTTSCLAMLPVSPLLSEAKTKKLLVGCDVAALSPPVGVSGVCARSSAGGILHKADDSRSGVPVSAEASGGLSNDGAPASIKSTLPSSYVFDSFPGSRTSDSSHKDRSPHSNHTSERNRSVALQCAWSTIPQNDRNNDSVSSRMSHQCISNHAGKVAYSLNCQRVWTQNLGQKAKKSNLLLTLMLLEELREAKAVAATLLHTLQANEVLLCVCCCYSVDHNSLQQHSFTQSTPSIADHNVAPDRCKEGSPIRQLNAKAVTRSSAADSSQQENLQHSSDLPSSDCLCGSSRGSDGGCATSGETGSGNEAGSWQDSNIRAIDNTCESRRGNHCSRCNWSSSNHGSRSNRWRNSSSSKFRNEIAVHRFSHSSADAVCAPENVDSALHLGSSERSAAEKYPPLLRHLLLLLAGCQRYFGQEAERGSFWLGYVNRVDVNRGRGRANGSVEQADVKRVAEVLKKTYSVSQCSGSGLAKFFVADAISASAVDADAGRDGYKMKELRETQLLDGVLSSTDSVTLRACVQHPFFWDATERADLLDCCAKFFKLHASPPARNDAEAPASATNGSCAAAAAFIDLRKRKEEREVVSTAMAAAELMASGWRGRLDMQLLRALGETGLPRRISNVESLLDFLRILRFAWIPWILNLSVEHLESLAQQYAVTPLSRGVDPQWSLRFSSEDAAGPCVSLLDAAASRIPADPTAAMQEKTAHAKYWSAERGPSVSVSEKCEFVERTGVYRDANAANAGPDTQGRKASAEVRYHACCRKLPVARLDKQVEAAASELNHPEGIRCTSDSAQVGKHDCEADQQQNRSQQLPTRVVEAGEMRRALEKKWNEVAEAHCCQPASASKKVDNLQGGYNQSWGNNAAQLRKRRRLLQNTLIALRDDVLLRQLNSVHPELFLPFCVIAGSSGSSSMKYDSYAHKAGSAEDDSTSQRISEVFDTHPKLAALLRLFGCCEYLPQYSHSNTPTCTWCSPQDNVDRSREKKSLLSSTHSRKRSL